MSAELFRSEVVIRNPRGLHMRAAAAVAKIALKFKSAIVVKNNERTANGKSWLNLMTLAAAPGCQLSIEVTGDDAAEALAALVAILEAEEPEATVVN